MGKEKAVDDRIKAQMEEWDAELEKIRAQIETRSEPERLGPLLDELKADLQKLKAKIAKAEASIKIAYFDEIDRLKKLLNK